jgi:hypothetical protein
MDKQNIAFWLIAAPIIVIAFWWFAWEFTAWSWNWIGGLAW